MIELAYYNEIEPFVIEWLDNLCDANHILPGHVDPRSIHKVEASDLKDYTQCHFFAGIGTWSYALRLAGWPDDQEVWTGSCPCQPFSTAGASLGQYDKRHLWPEFFRLISERKPATVFGEQVASPAGLSWMQDVQADLERAGYAVGVADLSAACVGAPHKRQRIFWVADSDSQRFTEQHALLRSQDKRWNPEKTVLEITRSSESDRLGDSDETERNRGSKEASDLAGLQHSTNTRQDYRVGDTRSTRLERRPELRQRGDQLATRTTGLENFWNPVEWILCRDPQGPRWRPIEPGLEPLVDGVPGRMGRLRAYGNAIVAPLAAEFVGAYLDTAGQ